MARAHILILALAFGSFAADAGAQGSAATDRAALAAFYDAAGGDGWTDNTNWKTSAPLATWHGVSTDRDGRVRWLELSINNLAGRIHPALGDLANLRYLFLSGNHLTGPIPAELGKLANLDDLVLSENFLTGPIPAEMGNLTGIARRLDLSINFLTGPVPESLTRLPDGIRFNIERTHACVPDTAVFQEWLSRLRASRDGRFTGEICPEAAVDVDPEIPADFGSVESDRAALVEFFRSAGGEYWTRIDNWLSDLPLGRWHGVATNHQGRVTGLYLGRNALEGWITGELGELTFLEDLRLFGNSLEGRIPSELGSLPRLRTLQLQANQLSGPIPPELVGATFLETLSLEDNRLSGAVPAEFGRAPKLSTLRLARNDLSGPIPAELGSMPRISLLDIGGNALTGAIPVELTGLATLSILNLGDNLLTGPILAEFGDMPELTGLGLSYNFFFGPVPENLTRLTGRKTGFGILDTNACVPRTRRFDVWLMRINAFQGHRCDEVPVPEAVRPVTLPQNIGSRESDRRALEDLYRATGGREWYESRNWLTDEPLRSWHGVFTNHAGRVIQLNLQGNNLRGGLPETIGNLTRLRSLNLGRYLARPVEPRFDYNHLTGPLPPSIGNLVKLTNLNAGHNQLSGPIPPALGNLSLLDGLNLQGNNMSGAIPEALGNLTNIYEDRSYGSRTVGIWFSVAALDLSGNSFEGQVPAALGNLTRAETVALSENPSLAGPVPDAFAYLFLPGVVDAEDAVAQLLGGTGLCLPETPALLASPVFGPVIRRGRWPCDDPGPNQAFTDHPIVPGATPVKALHFTELRTRIDSLRTQYALDRFAWTDPALVAGSVIRRAHLLELRIALTSAYTAAGQQPPLWTDPAGNEIRAVHMMELRAAVLALE